MVESVNVSVLLYVPVRSASLAPIACLNVIVTWSLETGPVHVDFENCTCTGWASVKEPLTSLPVLVELGSDTLRVASPALEITLAVVLAVYSRATPGVNAPNEAGVPRPSESVAGTVPPGVPSRPWS